MHFQKLYASIKANEMQENAAKQKRNQSNLIFHKFYGIILHTFNEFQLRFFTGNDFVLRMYGLCRAVWKCSFVGTAIGI